MAPQLSGDSWHQWLDSNPQYRKQMTSALDRISAIGTPLARNVSDALSLELDMIHTMAPSNPNRMWLGAPFHWNWMTASTVIYNAAHSGKIPLPARLYDIGPLRAPVPQHARIGLPTEDLSLWTESPTKSPHVFVQLVIRDLDATADWAESTLSVLGPQRHDDPKIAVSWFRAYAKAIGAVVEIATAVKSLTPDDLCRTADPKGKCCTAHAAAASLSAAIACACDTYGSKGFDILWERAEEVRHFREVKPGFLIAPAFRRNGRTAVYPTLRVVSPYHEPPFPEVPTPRDIVSDPMCLRSILHRASEMSRLDYDIPMIEVWEQWYTDR